MPTGVYERNGVVKGEPPVTKQCIRCKTDFQAKASHAHRRRFCSHACQYAHKRERFAIHMICAACGKDFTGPPRAKKRRDGYHGGVYCSVPCKMIGIGRTNTANAQWKETPDGYITKSQKGRTIMQHRYVMEQHLGRPLKKYENVHHKNGVRNDNRVENLEVWIVRPHKGQRVGDTIEWAVAYLQSHGFVVTAPSAPRDNGVGSQ